jgi:hypothetical protein
MPSAGFCSEAVRRHPVKLVDAVGISSVRPVGRSARSIARGCLEPAAVEIDDVAAPARVIGQHPPGQRMIALAHAEEASKRHHGIGYLAGVLVDHEIVHRAEVLTPAVINRGADDFAEEMRRSVSSVATAPAAVVVGLCIVLSWLIPIIREGRYRTLSSALSFP